MKTAIFFVLIFCCPVAVLKAQPGLGEFYSASREVQGWYFSFSDLAMVLGALCGILGGLRIYTNWQAGEHHIDRQVMGWFFSCLFLLLSGVFLSALFSL